MSKTTPIVKCLDQELLPLGFHRKKVTWNRKSGQFVDVIDIQISKAMSSVTLNIGVIDREVYSTCWGHDSKPFVDEPSCTVRARIGDLLEGNLDTWWELAEMDTAKFEIVTCLREYALPFLDRMHSFQGMCDWLVLGRSPISKMPSSLICLAILRHRLGEQDEACAMLANFSENVRISGWKLHYKEVAERLGCP